MSELLAHGLSQAEAWLCISTLFYFMMNGAQIFETFVIIPKWSAAPPDSFHYFKGKYGLDLKTFWIVMHSIHEVTFLIAIFFCWHLEIRYPLLAMFIVHFAVRVWTIIYFAPNIISFQSAANAGNVTPILIDKVNTWRKLNYLRVGIFVAVSLGLVRLCMQLIN